MSKWSKDQLQHLADVLLAAAAVDRETLLEERGAVRDILAELAGGGIDAQLEQRLQAFRASDFDLAAAAAGLDLRDATQRREALGFVSRVTESDDVHDLYESDFILRFAKAIGASPDEYAGLTVELTPSEPPPVPSGRPSKP